MSELLNVDNLKTYLYSTRGIVKAVDGINLDIKENEVVGLIGESGCGKSMTALSIMRLVPKIGRIVDGRILFKGRDLLKLSGGEIRSLRGEEIAMIFQEPMTALNPIKNVGSQLIEAICAHRKINQSSAKTKCIELLEKTGIPSPSRVMEYYVHQLSGGMTQRALIAMAILLNPSLLIADEPTSSLDVTIQLQVLSLLKGLVRNENISMLFITHDWGIATYMCDYIYVMYAGKIVEQADVHTIFKNPLHPYTKGLLHSALSLYGPKKVFVGIPGTVPDLIHPPTGCRFYPRCSMATEVCKLREPPKVGFEQGHFVSCWLQVQG